MPFLLLSALLIWTLTWRKQDVSQNVAQWFSEKISGPPEEVHQHLQEGKAQQAGDWEGQEAADLDRTSSCFAKKQQRGSIVNAEKTPEKTWQPSAPQGSYKRESLFFKSSFSRTFHKFVFVKYRQFSKRVTEIQNTFLTMLTLLNWEGWS